MIIAYIMFAAGIGQRTYEIEIQISLGAAEIKLRHYEKAIKIEKISHLF